MLLFLALVFVEASAAGSFAENWPDQDHPPCGWGCPFSFATGGGHDASKLPLKKRLKNEIFPANAGSFFFKTRHALDVYVSNQTRTEGCFRLEQGRKLRALEEIADKSGVVSMKNWVKATSFFRMTTRSDLE